jgi:hypothetical protein
MNRRSAILVAAIAVLALVVALPALAADPSPSPAGPGKSGKAQKAKVETAPITLTGTVAAATDAKGKASYTIRSGGTTFTLEAGPAWAHGANHPLKKYVGQSVTVVGEKAANSTEVDVTTVDGTAIRAAGKPAWAGGWKKVGQSHPGWSQEKADRAKAKGKSGDCFPRGQCKDKPNKGGPKASPTP